jgi:hypothetical protein
LRRDQGINAGLRQEQAKVVAYAIAPAVAPTVELSKTKVANDQAQQWRGTGALGVPETNHAPPSAAASGWACHYLCGSTTPYVPNSSSGICGH